MSARAGLLLAMSMITAGAHAQSALDLYIDGLNPAFQDWSWAAAADYSLANTTPVQGGGSSIRFLPRNWSGLQFADPANSYDAANYASLTFWIHGGSSGGQSLRLSLLNGTTVLAEVDVAAYAAGGIVGGDLASGHAAVHRSHGTHVRQLQPRADYGLHRRDAGAGLSRHDALHAAHGAAAGRCAECQHRSVAGPARGESADLRRELRRHRDAGQRALSAAPLGRQFDHALQLAGRCAQRGRRLVLAEHPGQSRRQRQSAGRQLG